MSRLPGGQRANECPNADDFEADKINGQVARRN
jgi:hypothetical protein